MEQDKGKINENRSKPGLALFFIMLTMGLTLLVMLIAVFILPLVWPL